MDRSSDDLVAFALQVGGGAGTGEADDDAAFAVLAAAEVDVGDFEARVGTDLVGSVAPAATAAGVDPIMPLLTVSASLLPLSVLLVARRTEQVDDDARASGGFDRGDARGRAGTDFDAALADAVARIGQIDRDARRRFSVVKICGDATGADELQRDLDLAAWQCRVGDVFEHVLGVRDAGDQETQQRKQPEQAGSYRRLGEPALRALSRMS